jgi:hypothetical protein
VQGRSFPESSLILQKFDSILQISFAGAHTPYSWGLCTQLQRYTMHSLAVTT